MYYSPVSLELVRPDVRYRDSFLAALEELSEDSERYSWVYVGSSVPWDWPKQKFTEYVQALLAREHQAQPGFVRDTVYWAVVGDEVVGRIAIRHELNEALTLAGGHIGYIVRPSRRRQGFGNEMFRRILLTERARGLRRLLITCDENNIVSEKMILKHGGVLENVVEWSPGKPRKKRFWITL